MFCIVKCRWRGSENRTHGSSRATSGFGGAWAIKRADAPSDGRNLPSQQTPTAARPRGWSLRLPPAARSHPRTQRSTALQAVSIAPATWPANSCGILERAGSVRSRRIRLGAILTGFKPVLRWGRCCHALSDLSDVVNPMLAPTKIHHKKRALDESKALFEMMIDRQPLAPPTETDCGTEEEESRHGRLWNEITENNRTYSSTENFCL